jgi:hypothetical protein
MFTINTIFSYFSNIINTMTLFVINIFVIDEDLLLTEFSTGDL